MQPHVFVVMPFGLKEARGATPASPSARGNPRRQRGLRYRLQTPHRACADKAGCIPFRADQEAGAGDIRTDMYYELVTADVVVADISVLNPNVFYELGVRHGVAPRGVFMVHGGGPNVRSTSHRTARSTTKASCSCQRPGAQGRMVDAPRRRSRTAGA